MVSATDEGTTAKKMLLKRLKYSNMKSYIRNGELNVASILVKVNSSWQIDENLLDRLFNGYEKGVCQASTGCYGVRGIQMKY